MNKRAVEIFQARQAKLNTLAGHTLSLPLNTAGFVDPRTDPIDACAIRRPNSFLGDELHQIIAPASERVLAAKLATILGQDSAGEIPARVISNAIQFTYRFVSRRKILQHPSVPSVISHSLTPISQEIIHISETGNLVIAEKGPNHRRLDVIYGNDSLSTDKFQSLEDTLKLAKKAA